MSTSKKIQVWIGYSDDKPFIWVDPANYNVKHGEFFLTKRAARKCYEDVRPAVLELFPTPPRKEPA